jgi:hypothetical protein
MPSSNKMAADGRHQDTYVEKETAVLDVVQVIAELFADIVDRDPMGGV